LKAETRKVETMQKYKITTETIKRYYVTIAGDIYGGPFDTKEEAVNCIRDAQQIDKENPL
jgi:hypothetical protein